ncbi:anchored repeat ABC transporter, substrate-binding protein [Streptomyces sp. DSM 44915]|uniref:Anchored repeat ABC transporter, substrate-binding protein n=1 Tax=Streptomyces chisholmiae TaxID=3075540 RepID=A0ABU2JVK8_9ACTN|nr:anchored repeat ABC transporter, substrate-binding protein [Streptomyces sp. DSM 44915]MDT0269026.1 anchored repeat ABC transporter, substrate-binding protein [Streptomyces sp. DSM 44915]
MTRKRRRGAWALALAAALAGTVGGCAGLTTPPDDGRLSVVTTTGILADLTRQVGGELVDVESLVPEGGDPHSHEPTLRDVRDIVYADAAFSNYLMLEEQNLIRALDANLPDDVPHVPLAERAVRYAAEIIPLVENVNLDTIWLGLRVRGTGEELGATRSSEVRLKATGLEGPGELVGYLTETFGEPAVFFDSSDGFDAGDGYAHDTAVLPPAAHTHMSWAFTEPGVYRLQLAAELVATPTTRPVPAGESTVTFAVGVDPHSVPGMAGATVLDGGHTDVTVDLEQAGEPTASLHLDVEPEGSRSTEHEVHDPRETVIEVPNKALTEVPGDPRFRILGRAGDEIHQLPQAVLGRHVHGEIDPHLWQNVRNAMAYVQIIRDTLIEIDPAHAADYRANTRDYLRELEDLDDYVAAAVAEIPPSRRHLVTTHDAFGYLGAAYGLDIAGFVTPNPATEPSLVERRRLGETLDNLAVPAVFLEPNLRSRSSTLVQLAEERDVAVCVIYGDAFDEEVTSYVAMMRANADSLRDCLR